MSSVPKSKPTLPVVKAKLLEGKRGLIVGIANDQSIAWGCARAFRAFGAEVLTIGDFHVTQALEKARELGSRPGHFSPQQFDSEWNVDENREWLGPELLRQLPAGVPGAYRLFANLLGLGRAAVPAPKPSAKK